MQTFLAQRKPQSSPTMEAGASAGYARSIRGMSDADQKKAVGRRLRVTARELGYATAQALADAVGAERGAVDAWFNGRALPPVAYMDVLCRKGVTLDWIYRGERGGLPRSMDIRLEAAMTGFDPPHVPPEEAASLDRREVRMPARRASCRGDRRKKSAIS